MSTCLLRSSPFLCSSVVYRFLRRLRYPFHALDAQPGAAPALLLPRHGLKLTTRDSQLMTDTRVPAVIGRHARMEIDFEARRGRTIVAHAYAEPPFCIRTFDVNAAVHVIVVCSGPGVFGGDRLLQSIHVRSGARVVLTSQAALQVHPSGTTPAAIRHDYRLEPDAELHCHWDPVIPFAGALLTQEFYVDADAAARFYWSDALMAGRVSRGESWRFQRLAHQLRLRIGGALAYLERFRLAPGDRLLTAPWAAADVGYFATTIIRHPNAGPEAAEDFYRRFGDVENARLGIEMLEPGLVVARLAGSSGAAIATLRDALRRTAAASIFQRPDAAGRK
jgi:urease accessory protein